MSVATRNVILYTFLTISIVGAVLLFVGTKRGIYSPVINSKNISEPLRVFESFLGIKDKTKPNKVVYGFLPYWSLENEEYLDYGVLTDISYFSLYSDAKGNFITKTEDGTAEPGYLAWKEGPTIKKVIEKSKKNNVRVSLTIANHDSYDIEKFLECKSCWVNLLNNTIAELDEKKISDVNLDFEYMGVPPFSQDSKYTNFVAFFKNGLKDKKPNSKLAVSVFADSLKRSRITNIEQLSQVCDALFIMAYDFSQPTSDRAGPVAPIGGYPQKYDYDLTQMLKDFSEKAGTDRLILGVPYYGYNWIVETQDPNAKRVDGKEETGFSISQNYAQIMESSYVKDIKWDEEAKSPYFSYTSDKGVFRQVYFENLDSLRQKYLLAKENNLLGVGIWALGYDGDRKELWELLREEFLPKE